MEVNSSLTDRPEKTELIHKNIETDLELLGATAVEDARKLSGFYFQISSTKILKISVQDDVPDTLESLRLAGIKIWVLTGDKVETAYNIAMSCGLIPPKAYKIFIKDCVEAEEVEDKLEILESEMNLNEQLEFTLLMDGSSLGIALEHLPGKFRDITIKCHSVLCCRLSPLQKYEVVHLMKSVKENVVTAAVGDGGNDVSMIQEAHIGLGIIGKEGREAAMCSDYAFSKFCMLQRILLVHGHYFNQRLSLLVLYFFYKSLVFMGIQFYFQINSSFSTQPVYDSIFIMLFNALYTAFPILFISLTEKIHPEETLIG